MFQGLFRYRVDAKGRLAVPSRFREHLPTGSIISIGPSNGPDTVLTVYPPDQWQQIGSQLPPPLLATPEQRALARTLHAVAVPCEFDSQGRVTLSAEQRRLAGIEPNSTVAVLGNNSVVEIWAEGRWDSYFGGELDQFTQTANKVIRGI